MTEFHHDTVRSLAKELQDQDQFNFQGKEEIVDVLAVPNSYVSQYAVNYGSGAAEVTEMEE